MGNKKNWGKEIKDVGTLILIVGAIMFGMIVFALATGNNRSILYQIVDKHFLFIFISGLLEILAGIIVRNIGKSKEAKFKAEEDAKK